MCKICVFAGTTEGRELVEFLVSQPVSVTACVATEYGQTLLEPAENLTVSAARLSEAEMVSLFRREHFQIVVDATHPYAPIVTENIARACAETGTEYIRLLRKDTPTPEDSVFVPDVSGAVAYLNTTEGNILLTTGSKELASYAALHRFADRVYARVLPMEESMLLCQQAALPPSHIIAMQGPFSEEMNVATLKSVSAKYMVTKESGIKGGFDQKIAAARKAGARLVVIGRPPQRQGMDYGETVGLLCSRFGFFRRPRVSIVGIGPGSREAMTGEVLSAIDRADCILGAKRMLSAIAAPGKSVIDAISPQAISEFIHTHPQYRSFAVAMSGDVGFFSGTKKLLPLLADCQVSILPGLSSLVYLCARLGCSYEDVVPVSLHGRAHNILSDIAAHRRIFVLVGGENGMGTLCQQLTLAGFGDVKISAGQNLSYQNETITVGTARELSSRFFDSLCVALIENPGANAVVTHGLPDTAFQRGAGAEGIVPMTKSEVRSVCLSKLRLTDSSICWDVGAGTGSVAIEMALQAKHGQIYAIEKKEAAVELLKENCSRFGTDHVTLIPGLAPEACKDLPAPTHVFIGGSSGNMREIISLLLSKNPHVRIVATAIALESVAELTNCLTAFPFTETEVISMTVARSRKAGSYNLMNGQNPIYIFTMQAGGTEA